MGEENENREFRFFAKGPDEMWTELGPLASSPELTEPVICDKLSYKGIDFAQGNDVCSFSVTMKLTDEAVYRIFGLPSDLPALRSGKDAFERFKQAFWPLLSEGKLSRKRFKKLLMSHGVQRNLAEKAALTYNMSKIPYFAAYKEVVTLSILRAL